MSIGQVSIGQEFKFKKSDNLDKLYEIQRFSLVLDNFSELDSVEIHVVYKSLKSTGACRPSLLSFFKKADNRKYKVYINSKCKKANTICYTQLPDSAKNGLIGHELSHIIDYKAMSSGELISFGLKYIFSPKFKKSTEYKIDSIAIMHGYGIELYKFTNYILSNENINKRYKSRKLKYYRSPDDIIKLNNKYYKDNLNIN
jgi:hypothetical protein